MADAPNQNPAQHMTCMEVWGGSQLTEQGVSLGGLDVWVYSKPFGDAQRGGDVYYVSSCATGRISRLLLADVSGHGQAVASTAADLRTLMRRFVNRLDHKEFVKLLNEQFTQLSSHGTFATAVVTTFFAPSNRLSLCNAGHPRPLLYRAATKEWELLGHAPDAADAAAKAPLSDVPLGLFDVADYETIDVQLDPGDVLVKYTDALMESSDANGEMLGEAGLLRIARLLGDVPADQLIASLVREITERFPENLAADDVTLLVVRASGKPLTFPLRDKMNAVGRFMRSLIRPHDHAPFPDFTVPNVVGAIIPPLARRHRATDEK
jgi:sigma-B regulation protein RsbU (phosphoserine phosphatase)